MWGTGPPLILQPGGGGFTTQGRALIEPAVLTFVGLSLSPRLDHNTISTSDPETSAARRSRRVKEASTPGLRVCLLVWVSFSRLIAKLHRKKADINLFSAPNVVDWVRLTFTNKFQLILLYLEIYIHSFKLKLIFSLFLLEVNDPKCRQTPELQQ